MSKTDIFFRSLPDLKKLILALHYFQGVELQEIAVILDIPESQASKLHTETVIDLFDYVKDLLEPSND